MVNSLPFASAWIQIAQNVEADEILRLTISGDKFGACRLHLVTMPLSENRVNRLKCIQSDYCDYIL